MNNSLKYICVERSGAVFGAVEVDKNVIADSGLNVGDRVVIKSDERSFEVGKQSASNKMSGAIGKLDYVKGNIGLISFCVPHSGRQITLSFTRLPLSRGLFIKIKKINQYQIVCEALPVN